MIVGATILGLLAGFMGFGISYTLDTLTGPTIVLTAFAIFVVVLTIKNVVRLGNQR